MDITKLQADYEEDIKVEDDNSCLILYDESDSTFDKTAMILDSIYRSACASGNIHRKKSRLENLRSFLVKYENKKMIIHYIGHGLNRKSNIEAFSQFPSVSMDGKLMHLIPMLVRINFKGTIILDCCNVIPHGPERHQMFKHSGVSILFELKGFNIICASKKGFATYYAPDKMTLFSQAFEKTVATPVDNVFEFLTHLNLNIISDFRRRGLPIPPGGHQIEYHIDEVNGKGKIKTPDNIEDDDDPIGAQHRYKKDLSKPIPKSPSKSPEDVQGVSIYTGSKRRRIDADNGDTIIEQNSGLKLPEAKKNSSGD